MLPVVAPEFVKDCVGENKHISIASQDALLLCYGCYSDVIRPCQINMMQAFHSWLVALEVSASSQVCSWNNMALAGHGSVAELLWLQKKTSLGRKDGATHSPDSLISTAAKDLLVQQSVPAATPHLRGGYTWTL